jgi:hypothetical protein
VLLSLARKLRRNQLPSQDGRHGEANYIYQTNNSLVLASYCVFASYTLCKMVLSEYSKLHGYVQAMYGLPSSPASAQQPWVGHGFFDTFSPCFFVSGSVSFQFRTPTLAMSSVTQSNHRLFGRAACL